MFNSIRVKLTLWYICVLAFIVSAFAVVIYSFFVSVLKEERDENLTEIARTLAASVTGEQSDDEIQRSPDELVKGALDEFRFRDYQFAVFTNDNTLVSKTMENDVPSDLGNALAQSRFGNVEMNAEPFRVLLLLFEVDEHRYKLYVFHSLGDELALQARIRSIFLIIVPLLLFLSGLGGYFLARESLKPIAEMGDRAKRIRAANLHERLPIANAKDELGNLAIVFNELLDRLDVEFDRQQRFIADASHELRTPLAIVQGESEVALSKDKRTPEEYRDSLRVVNDESKRLKRIVEDLFTLARADSGELRANMHEIYLDELVTDCLKSVRTLASNRNITVRFDGIETQIRGDEILLRRLFINLLDNAVKYNLEGGTINVKVNEDTVSISNTGSEIPLEERQTVFDRFYRADKSKSHQDSYSTSGAGLGLSIAKAIAELHQARIKVSRTANQENVFSVTFKR
jgi:heavy metal sensor kinase